MAEFKYNSVRMILETQLGMRPMRLVINGPKMLFFMKRLLNCSFPKNSKKVFSIKVTIIINEKICRVCFSEDLKTP